ncbi:hypothetical protein sscle_09g071690 [Sclerotinia sclerotiorum 1980 UF-70]|uniref:Hyaluronan/mRNA-binding protein domain-containing protein n=2 Tax=Sclerotinia sclerotiorum (strain ATCC 18683 / 1980 / Ss-1) TaxID=665079 RepID=A0A1D9QBY8_SCLS1|nr:hypothetical protein sscle_09g071690 [Sclerotinia sclerotiorum 1980 UF-70]
MYELIPYGMARSSCRAIGGEGNQSNRILIESINTSLLLSVRNTFRNPLTFPIFQSSFINFSSVPFEYHQSTLPCTLLIKYLQSFNMGKSHKYNDRDHAGLADGTALPQEHLPRYFAKSGHVDMDPKKAKKNGAGKGGWGVEGEEVQDEGFNMANARRRSNSSSYTAGLKDFKTKFEQIETEPVFEENIHGALIEELPETTRSNTNSSEASSVDEDVKTK